MLMLSWYLLYSENFINRWICSFDLNELLSVIWHWLLGELVDGQIRLLGQMVVRKVHRIVHLHMLRLLCFLFVIYGLPVELLFQLDFWQPYTLFNCLHFLLIECRWQALFEIWLNGWRLDLLVDAFLRVNRTLHYQRQRLLFVVFLCSLYGSDFVQFHVHFMECRRLPLIASRGSLVTSRLPLIQRWWPLISCISALVILRRVALVARPTDVVLRAIHNLQI